MLLKNLFQANGIWKSSEYSDLPEVWVEAPETVGHFLVIAGGLSLLLSRASEVEVKRSLVYTRYLHRLLREELKQDTRSSASAEILNNALHECGHLVDAATRNSLKACLQARMRYDAGRRERGEAESEPMPASQFAAGSSGPMAAKSSDYPGESAPFSWRSVLKLRARKDPALPGPS